MAQTDTSSQARQRTGWVGWVYFAGIVLLIGAAIDIFYGIMAIVGPNTAYFVGPRGGVASFDVAAWGWWSLIVGIALVVAAFFLLTGRTWARVLVAIIVAVILQVTGIWNDFLFGVVFAGRSNWPMTVQLNNIVNTTTGVREYNVNMAATILTAAVPLAIYFISGRWFVRGITAGSVKG